MRKIYERLVSAWRVIFSKSVIIIEVHQQEENRLAVTIWTTIDDTADQIQYLDTVSKELKYEQQQRQQKPCNFTVIKN
jgi:hypothetical protein